MKSERWWCIRPGTAIFDTLFPRPTQVYNLMQRDNFERFRQNPKSMEDFVSCVFKDVDRSNNGTISLAE